MPPAAVISAFAVGLVVTVVAALLPALRASRIPPVAAMQEAATPDRPLTGSPSPAAVVAAVGGGAARRSASPASGDATLWPILGGVLVAFIGVALLTPLISPAGGVACSAGCSPGRCRASWAGSTRAATRAAPRSPRPR